MTDLDLFGDALDVAAPRPPAAAPRRIETPADLQAAMAAEFPASPQQWAAITAPLAPGVVIAGAGSGKTTLMAARVVYLVLTGQVRPEEVLGLTFTTKAAAELRQRIRDALTRAGVLLGPAGPAGSAGGAGEASPDDDAEILEPSVLTYHAYAAQLLTDHGLRLGHEPDTRVVTDASRYQLGARVVERHTGVVRHLTDHPATAIQNLLALDSALSEHLVAPERLRAFDAAERVGFERELAVERAGKARKTYLEAIEKAIFAIDRRAELVDLVLGYRRLKRELGLMDFSDQIELAARLASEHPEVGAAERGRFRVVLLDEYQDTSVAQAVFLARLFSGPDAARGRGHAVTAVGDPNQAIYGWRGASVSNILGFGTTFPSADGTAVPVLPLTVNRRSDALILELANRLAEPLLAAADQVEPLQPAPGAPPGTVETHVFETAADELDWLAAQVRAAGESGLAWSDIGVLVRDNAHAAEVFDTLTAAEVPVEIVGLSGLLRLPEVAEIVAVLHLLHDVTANAAMVTLLAGPRWAIGPRDLALLAARAEEIAGRRGTGRAAASVTEQLLEIVDGIDPTEVAALDDALHDPGGPEWAYSVEARDRFGLLAEELVQLRAHVGEPLLDLVRRIVEVTGVDVELASATSPAAAARRDNLDLFLQAVADFEAVDGEVTLPALLAYLTAEDEQGNGLDLATPTLADSVKLLTVHRSKGLEWHTVFVVGVCDTRFPTNRSRSLWTSSPAVLPSPLRGDADDLPQLAGHDRAALEAYRAATKQHDAQEELRLGYVAFTRAAHRLAVTSYCWSERTTSYGPSAYQQVVRELLVEHGQPPQRWRDKPQKGEANPCAGAEPDRPWPATEAGREAQARRLAAARVRAADPDAPDHGLDLVEVARVAEWDAEIERLLAERRRQRDDTALALPTSLSVTGLVRLADDPAGFAADLARPMPRPPSTGARFGSRFHAWVEARFGQQGLFPDDDVPGRADAEVDEAADAAELAELIAAFERGPFAERPPHRVEAPFSLLLAGQVVRGRIDAVYLEPAAGGADGEEDGAERYLLVDWKTQRSTDADPLQLALYRVAWAELTGVPLDAVRAGFYYVRSGTLVEPADLPDRAGLEALLRAATVTA